jgi:hypothetical protein
VIWILEQETGSKTRRGGVQDLLSLKAQAGV